MALVKNCRHKWTTQKFRILVLVLVPVAIILLCVLKYDFFDALAFCSIYLVTLRAKRVFYGVYLFHLNLFISAAVLLVRVVRSCWRRGWPEDRLFRLSSAESIENVRDFCSEDKAKQCQRMKKIHKKKKNEAKPKKKWKKCMTKIKENCNATNCAGTRDWRGKVAEIRAVCIEGTQNATNGRKQQIRKPVCTQKGVCYFSAEKRFVKN